MLLLLLLLLLLENDVAVAEDEYRKREPELPPPVTKLTVESYADLRAGPPPK